MSSSIMFESVETFVQVREEICVSGFGVSCPFKNSHNKIILEEYYRSFQTKRISDVSVKDTLRDRERLLT